MPIEEEYSQRTFSRITNGPLTPPMVLYLILGWIAVMRGSSIPGAMTVALVYLGHVNEAKLRS